MKRNGRARRDALVALAREVMRPGDRVVDVGADHGHVAAALGAVATERAPGRVGATSGDWVVADGLAPFRAVDLAVVAGMGWRTIAHVLSGPCQPARAVLHAPDDPVSLRRWVADHGWRIEAESLAWEGRRYAELLRVVPGVQEVRGVELDLGPCLLLHGHPLLRSHLEQLGAELLALSDVVADPVRRAELSARRDRVLHELRERR